MNFELKIWFKDQIRTNKWDWNQIITSDWILFMKINQLTNSLESFKTKKKSSVFILRLNQYWFSDCTVEKEHMETSNKLQ